MPRDWETQYKSAATDDPMAAAVLSENAHLLPRMGSALDLACGLGGNARFLARRGLQTLAWDASPSAIARLAEWAAEGPWPMVAEVRDVVAEPPEPARFDVIVVSRFLERGLAPALIEALRPGGLLFYQTFTRNRVSDAGPRTERFRLADNELLSLFAGLVVHVYREEGTLGDTARGWRDQAQLVASKPE